MTLGLATMVRRGRGGSRLSEVAVYVVVATLAAAAVYFAVSLGPASIRPDQLAWLGNSNGQTTGIDPETGQPVLRLQLGGLADEMSVAQAGGVLVVTNTRTAEVTVVDLPTLAARQVRSPNLGSIKVLLVDGAIYVVDRAAGYVQRIDPLGALPMGPAWLTDVTLIDAVADGAGLVWVLAQTGELVTLRWTGDRLRQERRTTVRGAGPNSVLVAHDTGVTVLDTSGTVVQVGTRNDGAVASGPSVTGPLLVADFSPAGLVAAAAAADGIVLVIHEGQTVAVDMARVGCDPPGKPAVYQGKVYVPCPDQVVVLDSAGRAGSPIGIPSGGKPVLVVVDGLLIINVPGGEGALIMHPDGSLQSATTEGENLDRAATSTPATRTSRADRRSDQTGAGGDERAAEPGGEPVAGPSVDNGSDPMGSPSAGEVSPSTSPLAPDPSEAPAQPPVDPRPRSVTAVAYSNGTVGVAWVEGEGTITGYRILLGSTVVATPAATATYAVVNARSYVGAGITLVVEAVTSSGTAYASAPSNVVYPYVEPPDNPDIKFCSRSSFDDICIEP